MALNTIKPNQTKPPLADMGVSRYNQVDNRKGANFNLYIYRGINKYEKVKKTLSKRKLVVGVFSIHNESHHLVHSHLSFLSNKNTNKLNNLQF